MLDSRGDKAVRLAQTFRVLADSSRLRILFCCLEGPISVGEIADRLELSVSLVSHHLRWLRTARLVAGERHGRRVYYRAADEHVRNVLLDMAEHLDEEEHSR